MLIEKLNLFGFIILFVLFLNSNKINIMANQTENVWKTAGRITGLFIWNCMQVDSNEPQEKFFLILKRCLKRGSLVALDNSLKTDVIQLATGIELVRYRKENETQISRELTFFQSSFKKKSDWKYQVLQRITQLLNTHVLKIHLNGFEGWKNNIIEEARRRKKHQGMFMTLLLFKIAAVGLIMVPLGFQFLAVLGGKALLLAKMALILTAIQGLKKIATSNLNYGLYASPLEHHGHGPCKDEFCNINYNSLEDANSIYISLDVDDLSKKFWQYDRQWPYESDSQDMAASYNHYYQVPEQHSDLLHPFQSRVETFKNMM